MNSSNINNLESNCGSFVTFTGFTTGLTLGETERLAYLSEECSEVIKACTKIIRHGYESYNPDKPEDGSNRVQLETEIQDIMKAVTLMFCKGDITVFPSLNDSFKLKYMHYQGEPPKIRDGLNKKLERHD